MPLGLEKVKWLQLVLTMSAIYLQSSGAASNVQEAFLFRSQTILITNETAPSTSPDAFRQFLRRMGRIPAGNPRRRKKLFVFLAICVVLGAIFGVSLLWGAPSDSPGTSLTLSRFHAPEKGGSSPVEPVDKYNPNLGDGHRQTPLIFVGGMPRSGTTLMRAMLDAHPAVRCGEETRVIPRILQMRNHWARSQKETLRLEEAGLTSDVIDSAISAFVYEIIVRHGEPAPRLCNKDPFTIKSAEYLMKLFPQSKFIFMIRDPRATVHSIISRKVTITGFDLTNFRQCLEKWNSAVRTMNSQCEALGPEKCLPVHYEQLVLHPKRELERTLKFLGVPWDEVVLHHEKLINKPGGVSLSKVERSSDQVIKPVNLGALKKWVGHVPKDVEDDLAEIAPMMKVFGYDPTDRDPSYGEPDPHVAPAA